VRGSIRKVDVKMRDGALAEKIRKVESVARSQLGRDASRVLIDNVRMLGASERQLVRHVLVPSALTWIFSSLQTSLGFAMVGAVVGEYLGATRGLGYVIAQAEGTFDTTGVFAGMTVLGIVVVIVSAGVSRFERWLLQWKVES